MKRFNPLALMSLFALIGILGIVTKNRGFLGFFGYSFFVRYFTVIPDELFKINVKTAGNFAFFTGFTFVSLAVPFSYFFPDLLPPVYAFLGGFVISYFAFIIALLRLEIKESLDME